ncbi:MAG: hypothetical protein AABZ14_07815, partial [Candidatus Margulisiibacteriota bacterium]
DLTRIENAIRSANYILVDDLPLDDRVLVAIITNKHLASRFMSPAYGSEGTKRNNWISIYH